MVVVVVVVASVVGVVGVVVVIAGEVVFCSLGGMLTWILIVL
jgi:hypothetical protein